MEIWVVYGGKLPGWEVACAVEQSPKVTSGSCIILGLFLELGNSNWGQSLLDLRREVQCKLKGFPFPNSSNSFRAKVLYFQEANLGN